MGHICVHSYGYRASQGSTTDIYLAIGLFIMNTAPCPLEAPDVYVPDHRIRVVDSVTAYRRLRPY